MTAGSVPWLAALALAGTSCAGAAANRAVAHRAFAEILEGRRVELAGELYDPAFRNHGLSRDGDLAEDMAALRALHGAAPPDMRVTPELTVAEGDLVAVLWRASGTRQGVRREFRGTTFWRIRDGRIREEWSAFDEVAMLRWLGLLPDPGAK